MMLLTRYLPSVVTILAQAFSGAISVLKALNIFILWVLCRHHICEVHISYFMEELIGEIPKAQWGVFMSVCRRHSSSLHKMALEDLEFGKRALAVKHLKRETVGSFRTICILYWRRGSKLPLPLTRCLLWSQVVQNLILGVYFHELACIVHLLTALELSFTYEDLPLRTCINLGTWLTPWISWLCKLWLIYKELWMKRRKRW